MQTHKMRVVIPEDHRLVVKVPDSIRSGPADLVFLVPTEGRAETKPAAPDSKALARWDRVIAELEADSRPFHSLSEKDRQERHRRLRGIGRGLLPSSEELARAKREEAELEDAKFGR